MYVIKFKGLFEHGVVRHSFKTWKTKNNKIENGLSPIDFATKFRFKLIANFWCWILNFNSKHYFELRTYYVEKIN